jgi:hypothetical protein
MQRDNAFNFSLTIARPPIWWASQTLPHDKKENVPG